MIRLNLFTSNNLIYLFVAIVKWRENEGVQILSDKGMLKGAEYNRKF